MYKGRYKQWNVLLEWNTGLDYGNVFLEQVSVFISTFFQVPG